MPESREYLFVYGSLKRGYQLHNALKHERFLGEYRTLPAYRLFDCGHYPALISATRKTGVAVFGELYQVRPSTWPVLDQIEGVADGLYCCRTIDLQQCNLNSVTHAYFYLQSTESLRELGDHWPSI